MKSICQHAGRSAGNNMGGMWFGPAHAPFDKVGGFSIQLPSCAVVRARLEFRSICATGTKIVQHICHDKTGILLHHLHRDTEEALVVCPHARKRMATMWCGLITILRTCSICRESWDLKRRQKTLKPVETVQWHAAVKSNVVKVGHISTFNFKRDNVPKTRVIGKANMVSQTSSKLACTEGLLRVFKPSKDIKWAFLRGVLNVQGWEKGQGVNLGWYNKHSWYDQHLKATESLCQ
ncbi:hypothetical protein B0H17DRAFT_1140800 [Mycena rosella]|uniref:Uncharacterized protein n=1 Tax=Mycena rosella TaxID=1033263 RepID=A0AAD7G9P9_MYCRO|nr:hypothetical protein B0H17DRAFT_1140800 [Mycena rosella]